MPESDGASPPAGGAACSGSTSTTATGSRPATIAEVDAARRQRELFADCPAVAQNPPSGGGPRNQRTPVPAGRQAALDEPEQG